jgi:hypothetical protein
MRKVLRLSQASTVLLALAAGATMVPVSAASRQDAAKPAAVAPKKADVTCDLRFNMEGWSAIVSKSKGEGFVTCDNGQRADVVLEIKGGGLTFGKTKIDEGKGAFSLVSDISEVFGSYAQAQASAGAIESAGSEALTKGSVSLAITTRGKGWTLGVSGARFTIERAPTPAK